MSAEHGNWPKEQHQTSGQFSLTTSSCGFEAGPSVSQGGCAIPACGELRK